MPTPPVFQRAPRIRPELPSGEVEIPAPSPPPQPPTANMAATILPRLSALGGLGATVAVGAFAYTSGGSFNPVYLAAPLSFTAISAATAFATQSSQKKSYKAAVKQRQERYEAMLKVRRQELGEHRTRQLTIMKQIDPDPAECLGWVQRLDRRMWQRSYKDDDFLSLRMGIGAEPSTIHIKAPKDDAALEEDPLVDKAQELAREFSLVPDAPIHLPLQEAGTTGIAGPRPAVLSMARALAFEIAAHHSPDEVKICALFPASEMAEWSWLRWLPHTWSDDRKQRLLASDKETASRMLRGLYDQLSRRRLQVAAAANSGAQKMPVFQRIVFFLGDPNLVENNRILSLLFTEGKSIGALPIFLADRIEYMLKDCHAVVELNESQGQLSLTAPTTVQSTFTPDQIPLDQAELFARTMAPIRLRRLVGSNELPDIVTLLDTLDVNADTVDELDVAERWRTSEAYTSLAVPVGMKAGNEPMLLDLRDHERAHGPHGLVAGTTGSGKSELLQSLVVALAVNFHPHQVSFVLIDYKGGGMANLFQGLPHLVGTITNLQGNMAMRALTALKTELQRRQTVLGRAGENHIDKYLKRYCRGELKEPLPHLVIILDEFAELINEQPEFMKQLVSAVRVGRSLGVHLILATQKPAGVVNDQIWSNTRFRICLRVERPEDSREVLKRPDAASLTNAGRAYFQVGNDEVFELLQSAWGGAPYVPGAASMADPEEIVEVSLDGSRHTLSRAPKRQQAASATENQLKAIINHLREVAENESIVPLQGPWLPPLPETAVLDDLRPAEGWDGHAWTPATTWMEPVIGIVDDPSRSYQGPLHLHLGKEGHLALYGAPGSGKTSFLQTLVTSLAVTHSPQDVNIYLMDFGGRALTMFSPLPHVGGVVLPDEDERVDRLLRFLLRQLETRQERFANAGVNTLPAYRESTGDRMPAIVVILDNITGFTSIYPDFEDELAELAREGGNVGIHLVITANSPSLIKAKISGNITMAVALQLADKADYTTAMQRMGNIEPAHIPGRGLVKGNPPLEFQTAFPVDADTEKGRSTALGSLINQMAQAWAGPGAPPVPMLPEKVALSDLLPSTDTWPLVFSERPLALPICVDVDDLQPVEIDLNDGPHFLVTGPAQSGKTTTLQTWALALAERFPKDRLELYLVDFRHDGLLPLQRLPQVRSYIEDEDEFGTALAQIWEALAERRSALERARQRASGGLDDREFISRYRTIVMLIDDYDVLRDGAMAETRPRLEQILRRDRGLGFHVILAGMSNDLGASYEGWIKALREGQTGFTLGSSDRNDTQLLNVRVPYGEEGRLLPPGQGFYSRRGRSRKVKIATPNAGPLQIRNWVARIVARSS